MITNVTIDLNCADAFPESTVVTTDEDGLPLSCIYDDLWEYSSMQKVAVGQITYISFKRISLEYRKEIQRSLHHVIEYIAKRDKVRPTISSIEKWKKGLSLVARALEHCNWNELLDKKAFKTFQSNIKSLSITESTIASLRIALNKLYECDLCSRSFEVTDFNQLSRGGKKQQHIAIPMNMYKKLLSEAIKDVERYHPLRFEINKVFKHVCTIEREEMARTNMSQTSNAVKQRVAKRKKQIFLDTPGLESMNQEGGCRKIQLNCLIVVLAFSGARIGEALSFNKASYEDFPTDKNIISRLKGKTSKGNDGLPKTETWQTHPITKDALELAYDMSEHLREMYKSKINVQFELGTLSKSKLDHAMDEVAGAFIPFTYSNIVRTYVLTGSSGKMTSYISNMGLCATQSDVNEFDRLNPNREGQLRLGCGLPRLSPHDFRRTFAVFFKRYGFGSSCAIKFQYKHQNINMSNYYANNAALQAMEDVLMDSNLLDLMNTEGINLGVDIFDEIYNKSNHLSGIGGEKIAEDKFNRVKKGHKVYMTLTEIEVLIRNGTLSVVRLPTGGYCLNPTCSRVCGIGEFAAETKPCDHQVITDDEAKVVLRGNKRLVETFREMNIGDRLNQSILIGIKQKIKLNEITLSKHELVFEPFDDEILGLISTREVEHVR